MYKRITLTLTAIVLTACGGNGTEEIVLKHEQLPLTYYLDENKPRASSAFEGKVIFDGNCFYFGEGDSRMAVVFPSTFKWDKSSDVILTGEISISPGQEVITDAVNVHRRVLESDARYFIADESCLTETLVLVGAHFK